MVFCFQYLHLVIIFNHRYHTVLLQYQHNFNPLLKSSFLCHLSDQAEKKSSSKAKESLYEELKKLHRDFFLSEDEKL